MSTLAARKRTPYGQKKGTCRSCGKVVWKGRSSRPDPMCQPCRRLDPQRAVKPPRVPKELAKRGTTTARGYGNEHQWRRQQALAALTPGDPCVRCNGPLLADDPIDLDHTADRSDYLGLSHAWCNRSHKLGGVPRPEVAGRQRECVICGSQYRARHSSQRACSRACGWAWRRLNATTA